MLILTILQGPDKGRRFELPDNEPQLIGRSSEALPLQDQTISRRHAELTPDGSGRWYLNDLKSANGTYVNGQRVVGRRLLQRGDQVRAGNTMFLFGVEESSLRRQVVRVAPAGEIDAAVTQTVTANDDSMIMAVPDPSEAAVLQLKVVYELTQLIGSALDRTELLEKVMDLIFEYFECDRGFVLLEEPVTKRMDPVVVRHRIKPLGVNEQQITVSRTIIQHVVRQGEGVLSSNAMTDQRFSAGDSIQNYSIRSAMCVPIKFKDKLFGVIHVDSQIENYTFTEDQLRLLTAIGVQTALALLNTQLLNERMQRERLAAVGQTVASLSHSIKNILQGMRGGADVVEIGLKKDNMKVVRSGWDIVARNLERIYGLTMNMLQYSKQRKPEFEMTSLPKLLEEIVALVQPRFDGKKVVLLTALEHEMPPVPLDPSGIHQAVLNLLHNALDAVAQEDGIVTLTCDYQADPQRARIAVSDNGPGISDENRIKLFEPFHSTKGYGGTGLGLVVTKKVVEEHGGTVEVQSSLNEGTTFTLILPCTSIGAAPSGDTAGPASTAVKNAEDEEEPA